jgi:hypothetical protein
MEYRSRAVRSLVELHDKEMRSFLEVWKRRGKRAHARGQR